MKLKTSTLVFNTLNSYSEKILLRLNKLVDFPGKKITIKISLRRQKESKVVSTTVETGIPNVILHRNSVRLLFYRIDYVTFTKTKGTCR